MNTQIKNYYDNLAQNYDADRFGNTYGDYIHAQEKRLLEKSIDPKQNTLDLGCGTGRFLEFATCGIDISPNMVAQAKEKYPHKDLFISSATEMPFEEAHFDLIFSFHVFMHLDRIVSAQVLDEAHRVLKKGGTLMIDIPSQKRRKALAYKAENWHGANAFSMSEIEKMAKGKWRIKKYQGIAFFPIHRIPKSWRMYFRRIDNLFCRSMWKEWASYLVITMEKI